MRRLAIPLVLAALLGTGVLLWLARGGAGTERGGRGGPEVEAPPAPQPPAPAPSSRRRFADAPVDQRVRVE